MQHERVGRRLVRMYRRAARRPSVRRQSIRLEVLLEHLSALERAGDGAALRGVALMSAQAGLALAVTPVVEDRDRRFKRSLLRETLGPMLRRVGLEHVDTLVDAALAMDVDPGSVHRGTGTRQ